MSRRAEIVEEFDDDTDIPLPSRPLHSSGTRGAIIEEVGASSDEDESPRSGRASNAHASPSTPSPFKQQRGPDVVTDRTPFKSWTCVYPIYLDAKQPYGAGRRVSRASALWWPLAADIAHACPGLYLQSFFEPDKAHPRDWINPGRVRIQWKRDGRPLNPKITSKKKLFEALAASIQRTKPELVPREPYTYTPEPSTALVAVPKDSKGKAKAPAGAPAKSGPAAVGASVIQKPNGRLPQPPAPVPPLTQRVSQYSPALETGMLVEAVKASMTAEAAATPAPGTPGAPVPAGAAKGKKKVIRVRA